MTGSSGSTTFFILATLCCLGLAKTALAHDKSHDDATKMETSGEPVQVLNRPDAAARDYFTDSLLYDQTDEPHRFYTDLLHDKIVVMNAFFSRCENSCPVAAGMMLELQDHLGDRMGKEVQLMSISVDPNYDTVDRLRIYADKLGADPAWHFLTGSQEDVFRIHTRLGTFGPNSKNIEPTAESHGNNIFLANLKTGLWKKVYAPGVNADQLVEELDSLMIDEKPVSK